MSSTGEPYAVAARVVTTLRDRSQTLATAESLTGGLVGAAITDVPGASAVYRGGLITYATQLKAELAGVSDQVLAVDGPVAPTTAAQLACGAARVCGADWGLATTGVAGPEPQDGQPVGRVYVAVAGRVVVGGAKGSNPAGGAEGSNPAVGAAGARDVLVRELRLTGDRALIRQQTVTAVLHLLLEAIG